tara:strand:+ start:2167 stop:2409 length:243 start_codon:yes stop_codon:yes gene_type:complete
MSIRDETLTLEAMQDIERAFNTLASASKALEYASDSQELRNVELMIKVAQGACLPPFEALKTEALKSVDDDDVKEWSLID